MNDKYILKGHRVVACPDLLKWANWFQTANRHVAQTRIGRITVSTIFLGLDQSFNFAGDPNVSPVLFETMIFTPASSKISKTSFWDYQTRCATWDEAEAEDTKKWC